MEFFEISQMCIIHHDKNILLIKFSEGSKKWSIPGGHLERGEQLIDGLKREIKEEVGLEIQTPLFLDSETYVNKNQSCLLMLYSAEATSAKITLSNEHTDFYWVSKKDFSNYEYAHEGIKTAIKNFFEKLK